MLLNCLSNSLRSDLMLRGFSSSNVQHVLLQGQKVIIERTITEKEVNSFSKLTGDLNIIHMGNEERRGIVHGALLNGIVSGVIGTKLPGNGTMVLSQTLNFPNPCYTGDTVIISVEIETVRKIIKCNYAIVNKSSKLVVMDGCAKLFLKRSPKS